MFWEFLLAQLIVAEGKTPGVIKVFSPVSGETEEPELDETGYGELTESASFRV